MKKSDLKYGNVIETREGDRYICTKCLQDKKVFLKLNYVSEFFITYIDYATYCEDLKTRNGNNNVVKVYENYTCCKILWERPKPPRLSEDEKAILRNIDKECKYIARDKDDYLFVYDEKPSKRSSSQWFTNAGTARNISVFSHLFQFIKWEDEEAYLIEDLLHA